MGLLTSHRTRSASGGRLLDDRVTWQCASLLLDYPDDAVADRVRTVRRLSTGTATHPRLDALATHLETTPLPELQTSYVETFDQRRRCNLFLTYFTHGDTRKRGAALLRIKQTYMAAGMELDEGELPDHLCVVLEFAATVDAGVGVGLLTDHRASLETLRISLREASSPWAAAVEAVCATLPPLQGDEETAVQRLIAEGPPEEEVGLAPYGGPTDLGMPTVPTLRPEGAGR